MADDSNGSTAPIVKFVGGILGILVVLMAVLQINARINEVGKDVHEHEKQRAHGAAIEVLRTMEKMVEDHEARIRNLEAGNSKWRTENGP